MKKLLSIAIVICTLTAIAVAQSAKSGEAAPPSVSIEISAPEATVKAGAEMELKVNLKNISHHEISGSEILGGADINYDIQVRNVHGDLAPYTAVGRKIYGKDPSYGGLHGSVTMYILAPGVTHKSNTFLNKIYVLTPGNYSVQATGRDPDTQVLVKSNIINMTVTP
jgi:hypothetical protein